MNKKTKKINFIKIDRQKNMCYNYIKFFDKLRRLEKNKFKLIYGYKNKKLYKFIIILLKFKKFFKNFLNNYFFSSLTKLSYKLTNKLKKNSLFQNIKHKKIIFKKILIRKNIYLEFILIYKKLYIKNKYNYISFIFKKYKYCFKKYSLNNFIKYNDFYFLIEYYL